MEKIYLSAKDIRKLDVLSLDGKTSIVYKDGDYVIKLFNKNILKSEQRRGVFTEQKLENASSIESLPELIVPKSMIYDPKTKKFIATRSKYIEGDSYVDVIKGRGITLSKVIEFHKMHEDILKRATQNNIVLPDYLGNIIIGSKGINLIDYEGIQIEENKTSSVAECLYVNKNINHFDELIYSSKYYNNDLFTKELNVYTQYILFFLDLLDINIGALWYYLKQEDISIEYLFHIIGLDNPDIQQKVWKLFCSNQNNEYLEKDIDLILDAYRITTESDGNKRLVRK